MAPSTENLTIIFSFKSTTEGGSVSNTFWPAFYSWHPCRWQNQNKDSEKAHTLLRTLLWCSLPFFLSFSRPFYRLARLAKLAGHNAKDGLTSHGFMGFGNDASAENRNESAEEIGSSSVQPTPVIGPSSSKAAAAAAAGRKWGNIIQVSGFYCFSPSIVTNALLS